MVLEGLRLTELCDCDVQTKKIQSRSLTWRGWRTIGPEWILLWLCELQSRQWNSPGCSYFNPLRDTHPIPLEFSCIEISSVHSHLFLGGKDGTVEVYDLDRGCLATQSWIPNLWLGHEEILQKIGVEHATPRETVHPICTDVKAHPR